jgi:hypothetical protein
MPRNGYYFREERVKIRSDMDQSKLIQDTGLIVGSKAFEFTIEESLEAISNLFKTIKQYRDFADPKDLPAWSEYIYEIFHIFGFKTETLAPRLISLTAMGSDKRIKALVCMIGPDEDFQYIVPGLDWQSYLFYAAKHHQVQWVILTNGLKFKVLNYFTDPDDQKYIQYEFDEILKSERTDSFFTIYKLFTLINRNGNKSLAKPKEKAKTSGKRVLTDGHYIRKEFWTGLLARSNEKTDLFKAKKPGVENYLSVGGGRAGLYFNYIINNKHARVEFYIDLKDKTLNKSYFDQLSQYKIEIEKSIGENLIWDRLDGSRASIIRQMIDDDGLNDKSRWSELQDKMVQTIIKFEQTLRPYIQRINED